MRSVTFRLAALWALLPLATVPAATPAAPIRDLMEEGAFAIYFENRQIGHEQYRIDLLNGQGRVTSRSTLTVTREGRRQEIQLESTLEVQAGWPHRYELTTRAGGQRQQVTVTFQPRLALCDFDLGQEPLRQAAILVDGTGVLDENVFCHWALLIVRYNHKARGVQTFPVFVPQLGEQGAGTVALEVLGQESVNTGSRRVRTHRFRVRTPQAQLDVWADPGGRIWQIVSPQSQARIVRIG